MCRSHAYAWKTAPASVASSCTCQCLRMCWYFFQSVGCAGKTKISDFCSFNNFSHTTQADTRQTRHVISWKSQKFGTETQTWLLFSSFTKIYETSLFRHIVSLRSVPRCATTPILGLKRHQMASRCISLNHETFHYIH